MMKSFELKMRRVLAGNYPFFIIGRRAAIIHFSFREEGQLSIFGAGIYPMELTIWRGVAIHDRIKFSRGTKPHYTTLVSIHLLYMTAKLINRIGGRTIYRIKVLLADNADRFLILF